jgi:hypothetical protein
MVEYSVDMYISGHQHAYERVHPVVDGKVRAVPVKVGGRDSGLIRNRYIFIYIYHKSSLEGLLMNTHISARTFFYVSVLVFAYAFVIYLTMIYLDLIQF